MYSFYSRKLVNGGTGDGFHLNMLKDTSTEIWLDLHNGQVIFTTYNINACTCDHGDKKIELTPPVNPFVLSLLAVKKKI